MTDAANRYDLPLHETITVVPGNEYSSENSDFLNDLAKKSTTSDAAATLLNFLKERQRVLDFLIGTFANAPYLRDLGQQDPDRLYAILTSNPADRVKQLIENAESGTEESEADLMRNLRRIKQDIALTTALADISGTWPTMEVTSALSAFADAAVRASMRFCLRDLAERGRFHPASQEDVLDDCGWFILAMGKHGAGELNYSSDIDLIVFYDPDKAPMDEAVEMPVEFVRQTKRIVKILQERTADGYVFRTDLRLRPDPGATPPAISLPAALIYYESLGQNWERAALIKARPLGDVEAGEQFLDEIGPFIWRKYLDYAAIADVHSMKRQIHAHKGHGRIAISGHNVKLGRGGIREVEFFVQTQQLIAGGRNPDLRGRKTLEMLTRLAKTQWIEQATAEQMQEAYCFLRNVEHRIQMLHDEQTHTLPDNEEGLIRIANLMGFEKLDLFKDSLRRRLETVQTHYAELFEDEPALSVDVGNLVFTGDDDDPETLNTLSELGYRDPKAITRTIRAWHFGRYAAMRSTKARERLTELHPVLLEAFAATDNPDAALLAFDRFLSRLPVGIQMFSLLRSNPGLLRLLATIMGDAPRMAQIVSRRAHILDSVLDPAFFGAMPDRDAFVRRLERSLGDARSYEDILDRSRIFGQEQMFLIGVRVLSDTLSAGQVGKAYARLAEVMVSRLFEAAKTEMALNHGIVEGADVAVLAMGKLGGEEMSASSDLDLILLYDFPEDVKQSNGAKPLSPSQYFIRLTQRLVAALSAPTSEGTLYEVDFRLRPSGNAGPLATRLSAFVGYQAENAWVWEKMALTRCRVIAATSENFTGKVHEAIAVALSQSIEPERLRGEVIEMRVRLEKEKGSLDPWNIKHVAGGLIDLEFIAQYLQLRYGHDCPAILSTNTRTVFDKAAEQGILQSGDADILRPAIKLYQQLVQVLKLALTDQFDKENVPDGVLVLLARTGEQPDFQRLEVSLIENEQAVRAVFEKLIGPLSLND
ncbi:MAG: bifunctional [glutamine synthetase] adenylyltransferase/[glutamine synthetase]-adenylyl-L-tyrosine phosphorylase [Stappiaceae bacterium]